MNIDFGDWLRMSAPASAVANMRRDARKSVPWLGALLGGGVMALMAMLARRIRREEDMGDETKRHMVMASAMTLICKELKQGEPVVVEDEALERSVVGALKIVRASDAALEKQAEFEAAAKKQKADRAFGLCRQEVMAAVVPGEVQRDFYVVATHKDTGTRHETLIQGLSEHQVQQAFEKHGCPPTVVERILRANRLSFVETSGIHELIRGDEQRRGARGYTEAACDLLRDLTNMPPPPKPVVPPPTVEAEEAEAVTPDKASAEHDEEESQD